MTKKDFNELAAHLSLVRAEIIAELPTGELSRNIALATWTRCVHAVVMSARASSANFDGPYFLKSCGVPE